MANWLSTKSVAEKYGIPKEQIREWIRLRYLTCSSIGTEPYEDNDPLIDTEELDKALEFNSLKSYPDDTIDGTSAKRAFELALSGKSPFGKSQR